MSQLTFQYPIWFLGFCVLAGIVYAGALYMNDKRFTELNRWWKRLMAFLRFAAVTLISLLLLSPLLKSKTVDVKRPMVVIAQDLSQSAGMGTSDTAAYAKSVEDLKQKLGESYQMNSVGFGSTVREGIDYHFNDKTSNLSSAFDNIYDLYSNQNLGAVIISTDGIYNEGSNPIFSADKLGVPIYAVALGDTTPRKDLYIKNVYYNRIAYLGDKFTLEVDIAAYNCAGNSTTINVSKIEGGNARGLNQTPVSIDKTDFFTTKQIVLPADAAGIQRYRISVSGVNGESSTVNNSRDIFIEVLDARQKILILANAPHPDVNALRTVLSENKNYVCDIQFANSMTGGVDGYDFVILHQIPSVSGGGEAALAAIKAKKIPRLFILGAQTNVNGFNQIQSVVNVKGNISQTNAVEPRLGKNFNLFVLDEKLKQNVNRFTPLITPFGEFTLGTGASALFTQKIGTVETQYPLLAFADEQGTKTGVLCGEGIWKWRLTDYMQNQNFDMSNELISKTINYLALKEDKRRFRTYVAKNIFNENENILFDAELYNVSYELINEPDVTLNIINEEGKKFPYTFNKTSNAYSLNANYFPAGNYSYEATTSYNGENFKSEGKFSVQPLEMELYNTTADHNLLRVLCGKSGGKVVYPKDIASLAEILTAENKLPARRYESTKTRSIINLKWLFFLIFALLSGEWFMRRYFGSY